MSEQWWIDIDWKTGIGAVNLAELTTIQLYEENENWWELCGNCKHAGRIVIHVYEDKETGMEALNLVRRFLRWDEEGDWIDIKELRRRLEEVGKC